MLLQETRRECVADKGFATVRHFDRDYHVQQFRFVPDSYFQAVGSEFDAGLERLVYLRLFIEEETQDEF
jgi:hypothetical protein